MMKFTPKTSSVMLSPSLSCFATLSISAQGQLREASLRASRETLRFAQGDNTVTKYTLSIAIVELDRTNSKI